MVITYRYSPETLETPNTPSGQVDNEHIDFLSEFRRYATTNSLSSHGSVLNSQIPQMSRLTATARNLLDIPFNSLGSPVANLLDTAKQVESYRNFFLRSARFLGVISLRAEKQGELSFSNFIFDETNLEPVLFQLLSDHRENASIIGCGSSGSKGYEVWRSAKAHLYSPGEIRHLVEDFRVRNIGANFVRFALIHWPLSARKKLDDTESIAKQVMQDPEYPDDLTWTSVFHTVLSYSKNYEERLKSKAPIDLRGNPKDPEHTDYNPTHALNNIRQHARANGMFPSGGIKKEYTPILDAMIGEADQIVEKRMLSLAQIGAVRMDDNHKAIYKKQFLRIARNTAITDIRIYGLMEEISPLQSSDARSKLLRTLLKDFEKIFAIFNPQDDEKIGKRRWYACRPELYSPQEVRKIIHNFPGLAPSIYRLAFWQRPFEPESFLRGYEEQSSLQNQRVDSIAKHPEFAILGEELIEAIVAIKPSGSLEKLNELLTITQRKIEEQPENKEAIKAVLAGAVNHFESIEPVFQQILSQYLVIRRIPRFLKLPDSMIASLVSESIKVNWTIQNLYEQLDTTQQDYLKKMRVGKANKLKES